MPSPHCLGEVQCETVQQVWVVSRQDRHTLSQACPVGTHLKSFSYLHTHKDTKSTLSHAGTESCQSTSSLFPAVKLMVLTNPSCLVLHEVSSCLFSVHPACDRLFQLMGPHLLWVRMLFRCWLPGSWLSPCILTEQEWKWPGWCCHIYLSFCLKTTHLSWWAYITIWGYWVWKARVFTRQPLLHWF